MTRRERLMATMRGKTVDRPPVSFYELNGLDEDPTDTDPFNIYSHPSWKPLLELTRERTDRIVMRNVPCVSGERDPLDDLSETETVMEDGSRFATRRTTIGERTLVCRTRRDPDTNTVWTIEHPLKDVRDVEALLQVPPPVPGEEADIRGVLEAEDALGDSGIVMINTPDPLCAAASLFDMAEYTVFAMTEQALFRRILDRFAAFLIPKTEVVARALPGRLWRIYGPEYASPPYLPPHLFREYVCSYVSPMIQAIQRHGGYARIHSHGNLKAIVGDIAAMGPDGLDPIEPPPQGDVQLKDVRAGYGETMVLFGNLEVSDIETMPTECFADMVRRALEEGTSGEGRGFVLMPSACPYGREVGTRTLRNYETIIELAT